jgi:hypothetical protein
MQKAVKRFLRQTKILDHHAPNSAAQIILDFWAAVAMLLKPSWDNPRRHLVTKGVGVYSLMGIAADIYRESVGQSLDRRYFITRLSEFLPEIDWTTDGPLRGLGGESGVKTAIDLLRSLREQRRLRIV